MRDGEKPRRQAWAFFVSNPGPRQPRLLVRARQRRVVGGYGETTASCGIVTFRLLRVLRRTRLPFSCVYGDSIAVPRLYRLIRSRRLWLVVVLAAVAGFHPAILPSCAWLLITDQRYASVDGLVIASGDGRYDLASAWVHGAPHRRVLLIHDRPERIVELGIQPSTAELARRELVSQRVSDEQIEVISTKSGNWNLFGLLADWMEEHPDTRVAVLCERFASHDMRLRIDAVVASDAARRIDIWALPDRRYDEHNWWRSRTGIRQVVLRSIAFAYTWCQGGASDPPETLTIEQYEAVVQKKVLRVGGS